MATGNSNSFKYFGVILMIMGSRSRTNWEMRIKWWIHIDKASYLVGLAVTFPTELPTYGGETRARGSTNARRRQLMASFSKHHSPPISHSEGCCRISSIFAIERYMILISFDTP